MACQARDVLLAQFETAWRLTAFHLEGLTTEECLWRPAGVGPHVRRDADGRWRADWPDRETYDVGPPSIGWLTWHLGFWWSTVLAQVMGEAVPARGEILWPGDASAVREQIERLASRWRDVLDQTNDDGFASTAKVRWPFRDRPFADLAAWVNVELTKNGAEIGYARFLYAARADPAP